MASLPIFSFKPATVRVNTTAASKGSATGKSKEEKGLLDFILGGLTKQDQFYETDPILKKVEDKGKTSVALPPKKSGTGFAGLFAKK